MSKSWDDYADSWDHMEPVIAYADEAYASLCEQLDLEGLRILDFGCGTGLLTERMAPRARQIVALDPAAKMIEVLAQKQLPKVVPLAVELSPEAVATHEVLQQPFDLIVASSACAFVPDYEATVASLHQRLGSGGRFVQWDWLKAEAAPGGATTGGATIGFTPAQMEAAYAQAGFAEYSVKEAFTMSSPEASMQVLMGVAKRR